MHVKDKLSLCVHTDLPSSGECLSLGREAKTWSLWELHQGQLLLKVYFLSQGLSLWGCYS